MAADCRELPQCLEAVLVEGTRAMSRSGSRRRFYCLKSAKGRGAKDAEALFSEPTGKQEPGERK